MPAGSIPSMRPCAATSSHERQDLFPVRLLQAPSPQQARQAVHVRAPQCRHDIPFDHAFHDGARLEMRTYTRGYQANEREVVLLQDDGRRGSLDQEHGRGGVQER
eukprot:CAMPEP_0181123622 /NCGR_PEP_ID=MMETSP1071-20121207/26008_1 /TAXON_ID=35127 /ORGANISM="Thalassiosira sp., Strain NH16" /LENGTH=104 /DNA_ID=CAMNT_0023208797 /DNA_START=52 /DNA_END=366 /DNA_ORIENTATION=-